MERKIKFAVIGLAVASVIMPSVMPVQSAYSQDLQTVSLRGGFPLDEVKAAPMVPKQDTRGRFQRAYRQQPPMIPHKIRGYEINLKVNQCMGCHDWPKNVEVGAPKISETHYTSREGVALDYVARTRWNCNQCHVPQVSAKELVRNDFKSALDVD